MKEVPHPNGTGRAQCTEVTADISLSASAGIPAARRAGCLPWGSGVHCHYAGFSLAGNSLSSIAKEAVQIHLYMEDAHDTLEVFHINKFHNFIYKCHTSWHR